MIKIIDDPVVWDSFVNESKLSTLFHSWNFLKIVSKYSGYELLPYGIYKGNELIGIIPFFFKKIFFTKLLFSPPPMSAIPYLGYILKSDFINLKQIKKEKYLRFVTDEIDEEIKRMNPDYLLITLVPDFIDARFLRWHDYKIDFKYTYIINLINELDKIWNNIDNDIRRRIRNANKMNIKITKSNDVHIIYKILEDRYKEQKMNVPVISEDYLNELKKAYPKALEFRIAEYDGKIIGSEINIDFNNMNIEWLGGVKPVNRIPVNELMRWEFIRECKEKKISRIDLGGANKEAIASFKTQFGPELAVYFTVTKSNLKGKFAELCYNKIIKRKLF